MKFKLSCICLFIFFMFFSTAITFAADENTQPPALFKQYIDHEMATVYKTYQGTHYRLLFINGDPLIKEPAGWVKLITTIQPAYKADIKKPSSSVSPYTGTLEVTTTSTFYKKRTTKETAAKETGINHTVSNKYKFMLAYQNKKWLVTSAKDFDSSLKQWFDSEKNIIKALSCSDDKH